MPKASAHLLVSLPSADVAMFRFLLESYENLALFTVLHKKTALLKLSFAPESRDEVLQALREIALSLPIVVSPYPR